MNFEKIIDNTGIIVFCIFLALFFMSIWGCMKKARQELAFNEKIEKKEEVKRKDYKPDIRLEIIYFDFDKFSVDEENLDKIKENAMKLRYYPNVKIFLGGHADERGEVNYNLLLSMERALTVKYYYEKMGIAKKRISFFAYGEFHPVDTGHTEEAWAKNRRVETIIE